MSQYFVGNWFFHSKYKIPSVILFNTGCASTVMFESLLTAKVLGLEIVVNNDDNTLKCEA